MFHQHQNAISNEKHIIELFLDSRKVFDTIGHGILSDKLCDYRIRGITQEYNIWLYMRYFVISTIYKLFANDFWIVMPVWWIRVSTLGKLAQYRAT